MSEYFPLERIYESDYQPEFRRLAEYNDDFMMKARRFLKGDEDMLWQIQNAKERGLPLTSILFDEDHNLLDSRTGKPVDWC